MNTNPSRITTSAEAFNVIARLSRHQQHVLGLIAMGVDGGHHPRTLQALLRYGLIEAREQVLGGRMPLIIMRYDVPVYVHLAYCTWASEVDIQPPEEDEYEAE